LATGERNPDSKGTEVWIPESDTKRLKAKIVRQDAGWESREGAMVSYQNQPATIQSFLKLKSEKYLTFSTHEYSGIVEVKYGESGRRIDLYSPTQGVLKLDLSEIAPMKIDLLDNISSIALSLLVSFVGLFSLTLLLSYRSAVKVTMSSIRLLDAWILISSFIIYGLVLAAYWPAQMSPDSINQWQQIVKGEYNDAHPILSSLFYKMAYGVYPFPQSAVILQLVVFTAATWLFLKESLAWGANPRLVAIFAILFPLFPSNFLIVTTLWKDVPFTAGLIILAALTAREVRHKFTFKINSLFWMAGAGAFIIAMRHNGILIVLLFFLILFCFAKTRKARLSLGATLASQIAVFLVFKSVLLTVLNVSPILPQYRAINAVHVLGAMQSADFQWNPEEKQLLEKFLPEKVWRDSYNCESVVPIFWNPMLREHWELFAESTSDLNALALKTILAKPLVFLKHQICVTGIIWRIGGRDQEWLSVSPGEITDMPERRELMLESHSLLPHLKDYFTTSVQPFVQESTIYNRPALYVLLGLVSICIVSLRTKMPAWLVMVPSLANLMSLVPLIGAQDYRYVWPSVVISLLVLFMALGLAFGQNHLEKKELINEHCR
jgi:hypothetical protein